MDLARLYRRRTFQLENVSLRVGHVNRGALTVGAVTRFNPSRLESPALEKLQDPVFIERLDAQTEVIHVAPFGAGSRSARLAQWPIDRNEIDKRTSGSKLIQPHIFLNFFHRASDHIQIKVEHRLEMPDTDDKMVNVYDVEHC